VRPQQGTIHLSEPSSVPPEEFFRELEVQRTQALVARDITAIERLHAPEYQLITPPGVVFSRERYVATIAAEPFYASWDIGPMSVRVTSEMAVVRYKARLAFPSGRVVECWHTDTYERRGRNWQAVWSQATGIPPATSAQRAEGEA